MNVLKALPLILTLAANGAYAGGVVNLEPNQLVVQVNGVVCSFCAYGTSKNLSRLPFLDASKYTNGVLMDIHVHRITLALAPGKRPDLRGIYDMIKQGGYDPVVMYLRVRGVLEKQGDRLLVTDEATGRTFELEERSLGKTGVAGSLDVPVRLDATQIPTTPADRPLKARLGNAEEPA